ncbi:hypothetical protein [Halohasta salina]|uniref:hypothetical protein n=1 Tax=Halohasta salina TaxID=2961621 RepID=UPI0020A586EE|nr:hypothetical protein [Halohasta salina]
MSRHRNYVLLLGIVVALSLTFGTSSVSSVSADRGIEVAVADDNEAFLAFEQRATAPANGTTSLNVTVGNQYPSGTTLTSVTVSVTGAAADSRETVRLDTGTQHVWTFDAVSCRDTLSVEAEGPGVSAAFERPVSCH